MPRGKSPKSELTRDAIAKAARQLFTQNGFDRTTVRDIAAKAGADPALVIRYFGSKDALFSTVAEPQLNLPDLTALGRDRVGEALVTHFLDVWEDGSGGLPVLLRSAASNDAAAEQLKRVFMQQVLPIVSAIGPAETAKPRAALISSQLLGLALVRYVLKLPPAVSMERSTIIREVGRTVQHYATLSLEEAQAVRSSKSG